MSVYVIRANGLYKIGFSSNLPSRVRSIVSVVPGNDATFLGHMPGDRDVEAHLHERFSSTRFSGEWFVESPELLAFIDVLLIKEMPAPVTIKADWQIKPSHRTAAEAQRVSEILRKGCAFMWPEDKINQRIVKAAKRLGWSLQRAKSFYYGDTRCLARLHELKAIDAFAVEAGIAPELAKETSDE